MHSLQAGSSQRHSCANQCNACKDRVGTVYRQRHLTNGQQQSVSSAAAYPAVLDKLGYPMDGRRHIDTVKHMTQIPADVKYAVPGFGGHKAPVYLQPKGVR